MLTAKIKLDRDFSVGQVDQRIFGSFIEHLGRAIYGGIYEPGHTLADDQGFRQDVIQMVRELNVPVIRYPGGNFVSGYDWRDGIGPRIDRPKRAEQAWFSIETNEFGVDDFAVWCGKVQADPMLAVNLGTLGADEARQQVEYCNMTGGTFWSDQRIKNGHADPYNVKLWCLGNEMDGPWQIGHKTAYEYGRVANETAKVMKWIDPSIELVLSGSSHRNMPTFPEWERIVLEEAYEQVDYLSLHQYYSNSAGDFNAFLAESTGLERFILEVGATCDYVKAKLRGKKDVKLSLDEWNVWFHSQASDKKQNRWQIAPPLLEDVYDMTDALVVGTMINTLIRNANRVKVACLAQLVNVIAPIMTRNQGLAWRQTIYWPFFHASKYGRGLSLGTIVDSPSYNANNHHDVPWLDVSAVLGEALGEVAIFAVNRSRDQSMDVQINLRGLGNCIFLGQIVLRHDDLAAANTEADPDRVSPILETGGSVNQGIFTGRLKPASWNVLRFSTLLFARK